MPSPFFIVTSLSRCGSTAIHRALNAHVGITCLFEPDFSSACWGGDEVEARLMELRSHASVGKLNDPCTLGRIPNIREVEQVYATLCAGVVGPLP